MYIKRTSLSSLEGMSMNHSHVLNLLSIFFHVQFGKKDTVGRILSLAVRLLVHLRMVQIEGLRIVFRRTVWCMAYPRRWHDIV